MPVMDGIEATREIRRIEKAQKIGVFPTDKPNSVGASLQNAAASAAASSSSSIASPSTPPASSFRSPVIIVALTAHAESEDLRRTALLAGCNDYITKPVQMPWLERKIVDWGCMQALIDVDAWKEWKKDLEGTGRGRSSAGASSSGDGSGSSNNSAVAASSKKLGTGSLSKALSKRVSTSGGPRSIKGLKGVNKTAAKITAEMNGESSSAADASKADVPAQQTLPIARPRAMLGTSL